MKENRIATLALLGLLEDVMKELGDNLPEPYLVHLDIAARVGNVSMDAVVDLREEVKEE